MKEDSKSKVGKESVKSVGERIRHTIKIYKLKKKLEWIKNHVLERSKRSRAVKAGPEEKKLQILLKELDMLKRFNMLGFDSDAVNLLLGLYYMLEMIHKEEKMVHFMANGSVSEEKKPLPLNHCCMSGGREWSYYPLIKNAPLKNTSI